MMFTIVVLAAIIAVASAQLSLNATLAKVNPAVTSLDVSKYLGLWYQMYADQVVISSFEKGTYCSTALVSILQFLLQFPPEFDHRWRYFLTHAFTDSMGKMVTERLVYTTTLPRILPKEVLMSLTVLLWVFLVIFFEFYFDENFICIWLS